MKGWTRFGISSMVVVVGTLLCTSASTAAVDTAAAGPPIDAAAPPAPVPPGPGNHAAIAPDRVQVQTQSSLEDTFVRITPCRIIDTRKGGGILVGNHARKFYVGGTFGFAPQGGTSGGCGVPTGATAVATNVTTTSSTGKGYLTGYQANVAEPATNFISFTSGQNFTANPILPLAPGTTPQLAVDAHFANTHMVVDVTGYYVDQIEGLIYTGSSTTPGSGYVYSGSPRLLSVTWIAVGIADVTVDRDVTYCTPIAGGYYDNIYSANAKGFTSNKVRVFTWYYNTTTHLNVPVNNYLYLTITC